MTESERVIRAALRERILILDGAMGTTVQARGLEERDFRGERFADHPRELKGDTELLSLTRPEVIEEIHEAFFEAGADNAHTIHTTLADPSVEYEPNNDTSSAWPLPVTARDSASDDAHGAAVQHELLAPRFNVHVAIPAEQAVTLKAGQLATVYLDASHESIGVHLWRQLRRWLQAKLAPR